MIIGRVIRFIFTHRLLAQTQSFSILILGRVPWYHHIRFLQDKFSEYVFHVASITNVRQQDRGRFFVHLRKKHFEFMAHSEGENAAGVPRGSVPGPLPVLFQELSCIRSLRNRFIHLSLSVSNVVLLKRRFISISISISNLGHRSMTKNLSQSSVISILWRMFCYYTQTDPGINECGVLMGFGECFVHRCEGRMGNVAARLPRTRTISASSSSQLADHEGATQQSLCRHLRTQPVDLQQQRGRGMKEEWGNGAALHLYVILFHMPIIYSGFDLLGFPHKSSGESSVFLWSVFWFPHHTYF